MARGGTELEHFQLAAEQVDFIGGLRALIAAGPHARPEDNVAAPPPHRVDRRAAEGAIWHRDSKAARRARGAAADRRCFAPAPRAASGRRTAPPRDGRCIRRGRPALAPPQPCEPPPRATASGVLADRSR